MGSSFFGRACQVTVQIGAGLPIVVPLLPSIATKVFTGLHIKFKAEKDNLGHPNTLDLEVYNLSQATRKQMQASGGYVQLLAGYVADLPRLPVLFQGNARTIDHERQGPDWVTKIQCGDGETAYRFAQASQSFPAGTTASFIASYLAQQIKAADPLHIDITAFLAKAPTLLYPQPAFAWGYVTTGNAFEELQRLLGGAYELSLQNGELRALLPSEVQAGLSVPLIAPGHGMIGSPEHGTPNLNGLPSILKVKSLLVPRIHPGDLVQVASSNLAQGGTGPSAGTFRVQKIVHTGEIAGNDWQSELELVPLQSATPVSS